MRTISELLRIRAAGCHRRFTTTPSAQPGWGSAVATFTIVFSIGQIIDPIQTMMLSGHGRDFSNVVIDGRFVMENGTIPGVDEAADKIRAQAQFERCMALYPKRTHGHPPVGEIFSSSYPVDWSDDEPRLWGQLT